ncbi:hypothetical protein B1207_05865 [Legionella quinlivanii]|uniref:Uncharacterized protein n=1 Tax=Legionella quinlivanii TaxID=45073 RepID=A0A364LKK0_9GAMM|nr:hypothetical protein [Legionella quinlivanii]RAP36955.1 hypothetical protein B1207_05865 [Legionella quinlivanii]
MNNLQDIVSAIGKLALRDQRWILSKLPEAKKKQLDNMSENQKAAVSNTMIEDDLPGFCRSLATKDPLYIAIILEEGQFIWKEQFLNEFNLLDRINSIETSLANISNTSKSLVYAEWENLHQKSDIGMITD